jgi:serine palmitoyltransferase
MGSGYVFSAALPPYLATASSYAIAMLQAEPSRLERLKTNMASLRTKLIKEIPGLTTPAQEGSPVLPVQLAHPSGDDVADGKLLETMARYASDRPSYK